MDNVEPTLSLFFRFNTDDAPSLLFILRVAADSALFLFLGKTTLLEDVAAADVLDTTFFLATSNTLGIADDLA